MTLAARNDPFLAFRFVVEVDGIVVAGFSEVTGLELEVETEAYQEGGVNTHTHTLPVRVGYPNLTLRRGLTDASQLYEWTHAALNGQFVRKSGRIFVFDDAYVPTWGWTFYDAYPVKWTGPELQASESAVAMESLELAHAGLEKIQELPASTLALRELV